MKTASKTKAKKAIKRASKAPAKLKKKAAATASGVRGKAKKIAAKLQKAGHEASDITVRVGSTMETIGGALVSLVSPSSKK